MFAVSVSRVLISLALAARLRALPQPAPLPQALPQAVAAPQRPPPRIARPVRAAAEPEFCPAGLRRARTRISWRLRASAFRVARSPGAIRLRCESLRGAHPRWG